VCPISAASAQEVVMAKGSEKQKKPLKKQPQKTLKERRTEKRSAKKFGSA
jgi:hypothetical protein